MGKRLFETLSLLGIVATMAFSNNISLRELIKSCDLTGNSVHCFNAGDGLIKGDLLGGVPSDPKKGIEYLKKSCDKGFADACLYVGSIYYQGINVRQDINLALSFSKMSCEMGSAKGCTHTGNILIEHSEHQDGYGSFTGFHEQGCKGGVMDSCAALGLMYASGNGVEQDISKGLEYAKTACDKGSYEGCVNASLIMLLTNLWEGRSHEIEEMLINSCDNGVITGCHWLGVLYSDKKYRLHNPTRSAENFKKACDARYLKSCDMLKK